MIPKVINDLLLKIPDEMNVDSFNEQLGAMLEADASLLRTEWFYNKRYLSLLGILIEMHKEASEEESKADGKEEASNNGDLGAYIFAVFEQMVKRYGINEVLQFHPMHQALRLKKQGLANALFERLSDAQTLNINSQKHEGVSLIAAAIIAGAKALFDKIMQIDNINLHHCSHICYEESRRRLLEQPPQAYPIHLAVAYDRPEFIDLLLCREKEQNSNTRFLMVAGEMPLHEAVSSQRLEVLEKLLAYYKEEEIDLPTARGKKAIDLATEAFHACSSEEKREQAMAIMVRLIAHGAEIEASSAVAELLADNRDLFVKHLEQYLARAEHADLARTVYNKCHNKGSVLHQVMYKYFSIWDALGYLVGKPRQAAFLLEHILDEALKQPLKEGDTVSLEKIEAPFKSYSSEQKLSGFVVAYENDFKGGARTCGQQFFPSNPWSTMRWKISEGDISWDEVENYARNNAGSRTATIYNRLMGIEPELSSSLHSSSCC